MPVEVSVNLQALIAAELGEPVNRGCRPFWICPFHADKNPSLTIGLDAEHFKCFGCGKYGDAIDWVRERRGISFGEAVTALKGTITGNFPPVRPSHVPHRPLPKKPKSPEADWSQRAARIVEECCCALEGPAAERARRWLHDRGLKHSTIKHWKIGYNQTGRNLHGHHVHAGITIPWLDDGLVISVKVRRPRADPKYVCLAGSCPSGVYLHQDIRPAVPTLLVEGEFDALLAWQELRDLINVGTLGSATESPDHNAMTQLLGSPLILLSYDNDLAGECGLKRWQGITRRIRVVRLPFGKDLTEFFQQGGDMRLWIESQSAMHAIQVTEHLTSKG